MDSTEGMIVSGLDQDWAWCVEKYDSLSPMERGRVARFLLDEYEILPNRLQQFVADLACAAFLEVGLRWRKRTDERSE